MAIGVYPSGEGGGDALKGSDLGTVTNIGSRRGRRRRSAVETALRWKEMARGWAWASASQPGQCCRSKPFFFFCFQLVGVIGRRQTRRRKRKQ
ncbi:hypothetical protein COCNU_13G001460 [Cocos nucifera]|uniref:Uncharacterized protein n=1 Tax=Cocos nucifera TaxID=13894 RepID=A0A8K0ISM0_COCNU|nr:hypothetical protein COCNU_13G001460 [Cocos nucifera]